MHIWPSRPLPASQEGEVVIRGLCPWIFFCTRRAEVASEWQNRVASLGGTGAVCFFRRLSGKLAARCPLDNFGRLNRRVVPCDPLASDPPPKGPPLLLPKSEASFGEPVHLVWGPSSSPASPSFVSLPAKACPFSRGAPNGDRLGFPVVVSTAPPTPSRSWQVSELMPSELLKNSSLMIWQSYIQFQDDDLRGKEDGWMALKQGRSLGLSCGA